MARRQNVTRLLRGTKTLSSTGYRHRHWSLPICASIAFPNQLAWEVWKRDRRALGCLVALCFTGDAFALFVALLVLVRCASNTVFCSLCFFVVRFRPVLCWLFTPCFSFCFGIMPHRLRYDVFHKNGFSSQKMITRGQSG